MKASIIGSGTMGIGIVHTFLLSGYDVAIIVHSEDSLGEAAADLEKSLEKAERKGVINQEQKSEMLGRVHISTEYKEINSSDIVIEAVPEIEKTKMDVLKVAEKYAGNAIIATNTSSISIERLSGVLNDKSRFVGMHFFNPVPVMKPVEIVVTGSTSQQTERKAISIVESCGKVAIKVKDYPGFVANSILMPMINEAAELLEKGVASKEGIDMIARLGLNHPMGPLKLADLIGLDVCRDISASIYNSTKDERFKPARIIEEMVKSGKLGRKSGEGFYVYADGKSV